MTLPQARQFTICLLAVISVGLVAAGRGRTATADSPVVGTAVYQGAVTIATDSAAMMELGNGGTDIASTGQIALRPTGSTVTATNGVQFLWNISGNRTDLLAPGGICFAGGACSTTWPSQGAGVSYWQLINAGPSRYIQPVTLTDRLQFAKTSGRGLFGLDITTNSADYAMRVINNSGGPSAQYDGGLTIGNDLNLTYNSPPNQILLYDKAAPGTTYQVWNPNNDGYTAGATGPDASKLDGNNLEFRFLPSAVGSAVSCGGATSGDRHCVCAQIGAAINCLKLQ